MVIWTTVYVPIREKQFHITKLGGRVRNSFINTLGEIPVARYNDISKKIEEVVNTRGLAYGARRRLAYRSK